MHTHHLIAAINSNCTLSNNASFINAEPITCQGTLLCSELENEFTPHPMLPTESCRCKLRVCLGSYVRVN